MEEFILPELEGSRKVKQELEEEMIRDGENVVLRLVCKYI
jgi:hypothetical protein